VLCLIPSVAALGQVSTTGDPKAIDPNWIHLTLMDGSVISGTLTIKQITVETRFGTLQVPIENIKSFTPGLASHPQLRDEIRQLIEQLGAAEAPLRDKAERSLIAKGTSIRKQVEAAANDPDPERKLRIDRILDEFDQVQEDADFVEPVGGVKQLIEDDTIVTTHFTIVGRISPRSFTVNSPYGPLNVNISAIDRAKRILEVPKQDIRKTVTVSGTHVVPIRFKSTGIRLTRGQKVVIKADGKITLTPWGTNAISTPDGSPNHGWHVQNVIPNGSLVARVGKTGPVFKVGSTHTFEAEQSGLLELGIGTHPSHTGQNYPGQYEVKIKVIERKRP
jgi:hypothetical protein